jgi:hypothetical protein
MFVFSLFFALRDRQENKSLSARRNDRRFEEKREENQKHTKIQSGPANQERRSGIKLLHEIHFKLRKLQEIKKFLNLLDVNLYKYQKEALSAFAKLRTGQV